MTSTEIRNAFLEFFKNKGHTIVESAPCVPGDDPTILFTNAGMNQFKDVFLGTGSRNYSRACDTQKCIRVSGKHNDLEEVGHDTYHHTFFEMLGNWSFGDYFKKEAVSWAWEFLTKVLKLDESKLYVTVFEGDSRFDVGPDDETAELWRENTSVKNDHILFFGSKDNFWEMGDTGPCGPCTEIHVDRGPESCDRKGIEGHVCGVNGDCARFIEIWNLVFIQYNRINGGKLETLPRRHVDTGMGFERLVSVINGKLSNYDTDLFAPLFDVLTEKCGIKYGYDKEKDIAFRVIADHSRALAIAISDGVMPGNTGRGYVLRRLVRRALRYSRQNLGINEPLLYDMAEKTALIYREVFPEITSRLQHLHQVLDAEENAFIRTVDRGIEKFNYLTNEKKSGDVISGVDAFDLYSTYGFPEDLISLMARERGLVIDLESWNNARTEHEQASAGAKKEFSSFNVDEISDLPPSIFTGYPHVDKLNRDSGTVTFAKPLRLIKDNTILILDTTVFYAESGGQTGDSGEVIGDGFRFRVDYTRKFGDYILHEGELLEYNGELSQRVSVQVDEKKRLSIMANHTSTHLLHKALQMVLGEHATQQGSFVDENRLRFDFTHHQKVTLDEIRRIEEIVNEFITANVPVTSVIMDITSARESGAMAIFGEKYGERVRVVSAGDFSRELCGGTHVFATGDIGMFLIEEETSLAAGVRRIQAVTGNEVLARFQHQREEISEISRMLKSPVSEIKERILKLQDTVKELRDKEEQYKRASITGSIQNIINDSEKIGDVYVISVHLESTDRKSAAEITDLLRSRGESICGTVVATSEDDGMAIINFASKNLTPAVHCGNILRNTSSIVNGRGGGRPDFAQGGGTNTETIQAFLEKSRELFIESLK
ncbi:MAG: alanine--tRNA ligase [Deltaproteobacteria bacterium]|nr:alanine--tRNA ligase [Deltaproteobacteria bacterium]